MEKYIGGENTPKEKPEVDKEYDKKKDDHAQKDEESKNVTPTQPDIAPKDNIRDAKDRWDSESPAQKGQPNRIDPEPIDEEGNIKENPDEDDELEDLDSEKNVK